MTIDERFVADVSDLHTVRFECALCGATLSLRLSDWTKIPRQCPNCTETWVHPDSQAEQSLHRLAHGLRAVLNGSIKDSSVRIRFELNRPK